MNPGRSRHCDASWAKSDQNRAHSPRPGWDHCGARARRQPFNLQMGLGNEQSDPRFPGPLSYVFSEAAARGLYTRWARMMAGESHAELARPHEGVS